jgi:hypothetical protein
MARIPEAEIERLKAEVSVERLAEARGIKFERRGADLAGLCPFHEDHSRKGKAIFRCVISRGCLEPCVVVAPEHVRKLHAREPGGLDHACEKVQAVRTAGSVPVD